MAPVIDVAQARREAGPVQREVVFDIQDLTVSYGRATTAISGVDLEIYRHLITAIIGPSGCGKSTFIRCLNRMNDLIPGARYGGGSEWCSRRRIRFPSRFTTTSPGGLACWA
jgi:phosphate transport system ATP-binding protein